MIFTQLKDDVRIKLKDQNPLFTEDRDWKQLHYQQLAETINSELRKSPFLKGSRLYELGNTISPMTLKRFFENKYSDGATTDRRFLKSVDKLAIFLGFEDFVQYTKHKSEVGSSEVSGEQSKFFADYIRNFCESEYKSYCQLPNKDAPALMALLPASCPLRARMSAGLQKYHDDGMCLVQEGSRSNYELYNIEIVTLNDETCICESKEFWNLLFRREDGREVAYYQINTQNYFFRKIDGKWWLWDNYNPNAGTIMNKLTEKL